jgi:hypothetical protein
VNKVFILEQQLTERVTLVGIKARGNHYQVGLKLSGHLIERRFKHPLLFAGGC